MFSPRSPTVMRLEIMVSKCRQEPCYQGIYILIGGAEVYQSHTNMGRNWEDKCYEGKAPLMLRRKATVGKASLREVTVGLKLQNEYALTWSPRWEGEERDGRAFQTEQNELGPRRPEPGEPQDRRHSTQDAWNCGTRGAWRASVLRTVRSHSHALSR